MKISKSIDESTIALFMASDCLFDWKKKVSNSITKNKRKEKKKETLLSNDISHHGIEQSLRHASWWVFHSCVLPHIAKPL